MCDATRGNTYTLAGLGFGAAHIVGTPWPFEPMLGRAKFWAAKSSLNIGLRVSTKNTPARAGCSHQGCTSASPLQAAVSLEEISLCKIIGSTASKFLGMEGIPRHQGKMKPKKFKLEFHPNSMKFFRNFNDIGSKITTPCRI